MECVLRERKGRDQAVRSSCTRVGEDEEQAKMTEVRSALRERKHESVWAQK